MARILPSLLALALLLSLASAATVNKRDVNDVLAEAEGAVGDFQNKLKNSLGLGSNDVLDQLEDLDKDKYCVTDTNCIQPIQHCDTADQLKIYGKCEFVVWFWIALAAAVAVLFCSCITSVLCCCCSSLCRKAT